MKKFLLNTSAILLLAGCCDEERPITGSGSNSINVNPPSVATSANTNATSTESSVAETDSTLKQDLTEPASELKKDDMEATVNMMSSRASEETETHPLNQGNNIGGEDDSRMTQDNEITAALDEPHDQQTDPADLETADSGGEKLAVEKDVQLGAKDNLDTNSKAPDELISSSSEEMIQVIKSGEQQDKTTRRILDHSEHTDDATLDGQTAVVGTVTDLSNEKITVKIEEHIDSSTEFGDVIRATDDFTDSDSQESEFHSVKTDELVDNIGDAGDDSGQESEDTTKLTITQNEADPEPAKKKTDETTAKMNEAEMSSSVETDITIFDDNDSSISNEEQTSEITNTDLDDKSAVDGAVEVTDAIVNGDEQTVETAPAEVIDQAAVDEAVEVTDAIPHDNEQTIQRSLAEGAYESATDSRDEIAAQNNALNAESQNGSTKEQVQAASPDIDIETESENISGTDEQLADEIIDDTALNMKKIKVVKSESPDTKEQKTIIDDESQAKLKAELEKAAGIFEQTLNETEDDAAEITQTIGNDNISTDDKAIDDDDELSSLEKRLQDELEIAAGVKAEEPSEPSSRSDGAQMNVAGNKSPVSNETVPESDINNTTLKALEDILNE